LEVKQPSAFLKTFLTCIYIHISKLPVDRSSRPSVFKECSVFLRSKEKKVWDAARNGDVSLMKKYLDAGADVNYKNSNEVARNNIRPITMRKQFLK